MWKGAQNFHPFSSVPPSMFLHVFSYLESLQTLSFCFFFLWRLHYVGMTDVHHWPLVFNSTFSLSPFLRGWGMRLKVSALYFIWLGFLWQSALILRLSRTPTHLLPHYTKRHKHVPDHHNKGILQ